MAENPDNSKFKDGVNKNARLIIRNISFKATEESLKEHFSQYGTVEELKLLRRPDGKLVGCGFVHYTHVPMANKAITATNKKQFMGRPLTVAWAVDKKKYVAKMDNPKPRLDSESSDVDKESKNQSKTKEKDKNRVNRKARLIIRNVSFKATEDTLKEHFGQYGDVLDVNLLKKPDGKLVGCAFVLFKNVPMAKKALLNTNMKPFLGRPISVDWAVAKDKYMQHTINQQLELQDDVKKEDPDSNDDEKPLNTSNEELKQEIKSESESDEDVKSENESSEGSLKSEDNDTDNSDNDGTDDDNDTEDDDDNNEDDDEEVQEEKEDKYNERKHIQLNDAEDGCTVFITNIPFSIENDQLKTFIEQFGPVKYALVCVDKMTEHSKGSGFAKFVNKDDADKFLSLSSDQLKLEGQVLQVKPALKRENVQKSNKKEAKDNRNLYLVKEGVIVAGTKAAVGVPASDMAKRLTLERSKTQMLKNLNRFVSRYRLVVSNLPPSCDDARLRRVCSGAVRGAVVTEARVMRDLRAAPTASQHPSKGYGFVMFTKHEEALACLRKLNNNPDIFDKNNRPIVSFSIEDRTALNARKKRLEKSIANNPLVNKNEEECAKRRGKKRKSAMPPDESYVKKGRFQNNFKNKKGQEPGRFVKQSKSDDTDEFTGLTAKEGALHKLRTNHKLKSQAELHRQNVKLEKKKNKKTSRLKMAAKERIKQPKQKINKERKGNKRRRFKRDKSAL